MLEQLGVIEIEKAQGVLSLEHLVSAAVKGNQRSRGIEDAAEVIGDPRPSAEDMSLEARCAEDLAAAETVARFKGDAGLVPRGDEDGVEPSLGEFEAVQIAGKSDSRERPEQRQGGRQQGGVEDHHPSTAGRQNDVDLDFVARNPGRGRAGFLQRELELEGGAEIMTGEVAEVEAFCGGPAGGDERVPRVGPPGGARAQPLHGRANIEPLQEGGDGVWARTVGVFADGAAASGKRAPGVGDSDGAGRLRDLGFKTVAGPYDACDSAFGVEVIAAFGDAAGQISQDFTALDVKETGLL